MTGAGKKTKAVDDVNFIFEGFKLLMGSSKLKLFKDAAHLDLWGWRCEDQSLDFEKEIILLSAFCLMRLEPLQVIEGIQPPLQLFL